MKALLASCLVLCPTSTWAAVFNPDVFTLSNGMQVIVVKNTLSPAVVQMVWYKVGAADDPQGRSGLAHFLEHMMFKGTVSIGRGMFSEIVASHGGDENAFTTHDTTAYHISVAADRLPLMMQMEADRMRGLLLDEQEALTERSVVSSERQERTDNSPQGLFREKMAAALYTDHPYGRPVIGWKSEIESLTPQDARAFYNHHYTPNNAVLVVSGNVDAADVVRLASGTFGRILAQKNEAKDIFPPLKKPSQARIEMQDKRITQPVYQRQIAFDKGRLSAQETYAFEVLVELLAGGEVGLLHKKLVIETKIASAIDVSFSSISRGPKHFSWAATPSPSHTVRNVEKAVLHELAHFSSQGLSERDVAAAKQRLLDSAVFARDRLMAPAQILGGAIASGESVEEGERWPERIAAVSTAQVNAALEKVLASPFAVSGILEPEGKGQ